jgi:hypothetical protein
MEGLVNRILSLAFVVSLGVASSRGEVVRADLSGSVDKDIIFESAAAPSAVFGENPVAKQMLVVDKYDDGHHVANGLPPSRVVASSNPNLGSYILQPYTGPNVIELASHRSAPPESHVIDLPDKKYELIGLLVTSVDGDTSFTIKLNYVDGTAATNWWEADDWADTGKEVRPGQHPVLNGMDRAANSGAIEDVNHYSLFEVAVSPDKARALDSITVGNDPNRFPDNQGRWAAIFAINAYAKGIAAAAK